MSENRYEAWVKNISAILNKNAWIFILPYRTAVSDKDKKKEATPDTKAIFASSAYARLV